MEEYLKALETGKKIRLDGGSAGVYFAETVQQFWEALRAFEAQGAGYSMEIVE